MTLSGRRRSSTKAGQNNLPAHQDQARAHQAKPQARLAARMTASLGFRCDAPRERVREHPDPRCTHRNADRDSANDDVGLDYPLLSHRFELARPHDQWRGDSRGGRDRGSELHDLSDSRAGQG
ncbi:MAG: hypothetical protein Q4G46_10130 [Propionibacteriaceae bacterium]|nr:hypothetical protein [Propionibacteriaceae bacterium]